MPNNTTERTIITYWLIDEDKKETVLSSEYLPGKDMGAASKEAKNHLKSLGQKHGCWITTQRLNDDLSLLGRHTWETTSVSPMILYNDGKIRTLQELI